MPIVFDAYGTLWDVTKIAHACEEVAGPDLAGPLLDLWRRKQLEYAWLRTVMQRYASFEKVTTDALQFSLAAWQLHPGPAGVQTLVDAWFHPHAYPDALPALRSLQGYACAILSNGDPEMLRQGVLTTGMGDVLAAEDVLSVAPSQRYKPHPDAYQLACDHWKTEPTHIVFVSSNGWDIAGASHFGFQTLWVNRSGSPPEALGIKPLGVVGALSELLAVVGPTGVDRG